MRLRSRRGLLVYQLALIIVAVVVVIALAMSCGRRQATVSTSPPPAPSPTNAPPDTSPVTSPSASPSILPNASPAEARRRHVGAVPVMQKKPAPISVVFGECPADGDGGDRALNLLKNRIDTASAYSVAVDSIVALPWPASAGRHNRSTWSASDRAMIARYEGTPVTAEGYLGGAKAEGAESPNCHGADASYHDFHLWLVSTPDSARERSVVIETTPRVRANHPSWTIGALRSLVRSQERVRITGWLMFDQEHPDQLGKTRGTLWEIHPITRIEVQRGRTWRTLDDLAK